MAFTADGFEGAGDKDGLEIWKIKGKEVTYSRLAAGTLTTDSSYIVLNTGRPSGRGVVVHAVYVWHGTNATKDDAYRAASLADELDQNLGGTAKIRRYMQGREADEFIKLFTTGLVYRNGDVTRSSALQEGGRSAQDHALLHLKGKTHVRAWEVPIEIRSLNSAGTFILDEGHRLTLWCGNKLDAQERRRALEFLQAMAETHKDKPATRVVEQRETSGSGGEFYATLGAKDASKIVIQPASAEARAAVDFNVPPRLFKVSESETDVTTEEVVELPFTRTLLLPDAVLALAAGNKLHVWHGREASLAQQPKVALGEQLLSTFGLPLDTQVVVEKEGLESNSFLEAFESLSPSTPRAEAKVISEQSPASSLDSEAGSQLSQNGHQLRPAPAVADPLSGSQESTPKKRVPGARSTSASPLKSSPVSTGHHQQQGSDSSAEKPKPQGVARAIQALYGSSGAEPKPPGAQKPAQESGQRETNATAAEQAEADGKVLPGPSPRTPQRDKEDIKEFKQLDGTSGDEATSKPPEKLTFVAEVDILPYKELKEMRAESGIDMTRKEAYLSPAEFKEVFGKSVLEFKAQPKWRQLEAKKKVGLF